jgi:hypothetical protein
MCHGTKLCREEIENVPKNFNPTEVIFKILLFWIKSHGPTVKKHLSSDYAGLIESDER